MNEKRFPRSFSGKKIFGVLCHARRLVLLHLKGICWFVAAALKSGGIGVLAFLENQHENLHEEWLLFALDQFQQSSCSLCSCLDWEIYVSSYIQLQKLSAPVHCGG